MAINQENAKIDYFGNLQTSKVFSNSDNTHVKKDFEVSLTENMEIRSHDRSEQIPADQNQYQQIQNNHQMQTQIILVENIGIKESMLNRNLIIIDKQHNQEVTSMDRILNSDRIRFNGKYVVAHDDNSWNTHLLKTVTSYVVSEEKNISQLSLRVAKSQNAFAINDIVLPTSKIISTTQSNVVEFSSYLHLVASTFIADAHDAADGKNPTIFLLLVPLSGYLFAKTEEVDFRFVRSKQFSSFCLVIILVS
ncbi:MAG: hypothetical protein KGL95_11325, partial [Patescibacteria group bacterium]|nr:hypothetical protein [Patescibacteria group bacterium]